MMGVGAGGGTDTQIVDCLANFLLCDQERRKLALVIFSLPLTSAHTVPHTQMPSLRSFSCAFTSVASIVGLFDLLQ